MMNSPLDSQSLAQALAPLVEFFQERSLPAPDDVTGWRDLLRTVFGMFTNVSPEAAESLDRMAEALAVALPQLATTGSLEQIRAEMRNMAGESFPDHPAREGVDVVSDTAQQLLSLTPLLAQTFAALGQPDLLHYLRNPLPPARRTAHQDEIRAEIAGRSREMETSPQGVMENVSVESWVLTWLALSQSPGAAPTLPDLPQWILNRISNEVMDNLVPGWRVIERERRQQKTEYLSSELMDHEGDEDATLALSDLLRALSERERTLATLLVQGYSPTEAATRMGIRPSTARVLRHRIRAKFEKTSRAL